jgi:hypothetical protein
MSADLSGSSPGFAFETTRQVEAAVAALRQRANIRPDVWQSLQPSQRLSALQEVDDRLAAIQGRPRVTVRSDDNLGSAVFGMFDGERIIVNRRHLRRNMPIAELVDTVIHEGRHTYPEACGGAHWLPHGRCADRGLVSQLRCLPGCRDLWSGTVPNAAA